jgi:hypothetical protein
MWDQEVLGVELAADPQAAARHEPRIFPTTYGLVDTFRRRAGARSEKRHACYFISKPMDAAREDQR